MSAFKCLRPCPTIALLLPQSVSSRLITLNFVCLWLPMESVVRTYDDAHKTGISELSNHLHIAI